MLRIFAGRVGSLTSSSELRWILSETHVESDMVRCLQVQRSLDPFHGSRVDSSSNLQSVLLVLCTCHGVLAGCYGVLAGMEFLLVDIDT